MNQYSELVLDMKQFTDSLSGLLHNGPFHSEETFMLTFPDFFCSPFSLCMIPPYSLIASNATTIGDLIGDRQCGKIHALLFLSLKVVCSLDSVRLKVLSKYASAQNTRYLELIHHRRLPRLHRNAFFSAVHLCQNTMTLLSVSDVES